MRPTTSLKDPDYTTPYVDVDEWRDEPVRHRYVHGGFEGTDLRFSYYFPPEEQYEGRFFQPVLAVSGTEHVFGSRHGCRAWADRSRSPSTAAPTWSSRTSAR